MEKEYWENFYKTHKTPLNPSLFARSIFKDDHLKGGSVLELGCGNGRDSIFFASKGFHVLAVDQCEGEISSLSKMHQVSNLRFMCSDFTHLGDIGIFDNIYSRFTLHSVTEKDEGGVILWSYQHLSSGGNLFIEARGRKNELYGKGIPVKGDPHAFIYDNHYRRFIDIDVLTRKLESNEFKIILAEEDYGFAPFEETDQVFIRIIARKK